MFTEPRLGSVGLNPQRAETKGVEHRVFAGEMTKWKHYRQLAADYARYSIVLDPASDKLLGAGFLGPAAEELTNVAALAIHHDLTASQLRETRFAYPTAASLFSYMLKG